MVNDIWVRAWVQKKGLANASAVTGSGSSPATLHQTDGIQKMNAQNRDNDTRDRATGGQSGGSSNQNGGNVFRSGQRGSPPIRGTGGTPAGTGGNKNQHPV